MVFKPAICLILGACTCTAATSWNMRPAGTPREDRQFFFICLVKPAATVSRVCALVSCLIQNYRYHRVKTKSRHDINTDSPRLPASTDLYWWESGFTYTFNLPATSMEKPSLGRKESKRYEYASSVSHDNPEQEV